MRIFVVILLCCAFGVSSHEYTLATPCASLRIGNDEGHTVCLIKVKVRRNQPVEHPASPESARLRKPVEVSVSDPPSHAPNANIRGFPVFLGKCERGTARGFIEQIPGCNTNDPTVTAPPPPTPDQYAAAFLTELKTLVPKPLLHVAPGWALVGKYADLEAVAPLQYANTNGVITWDCAVGSSSVDWGDGSVEKMTRSTAGPWPDGSVRHVYINKGFYDVVVAETWNCAIDTPTGPTVLVLDGVTSPLTVRADEIQAVGVN